MESVKVVKKIRWHVVTRSDRFQVFDSNGMVYEEYSVENNRKSAESQARQFIKNAYELYKENAEIIVEAEITDPPREYTKEEVREKVYDHFRMLINYWDTQGSTRRDAIDGVVFSIMSMIDGCAGNMPAFIFAPDPHPDDADFRRDGGENWYPENYNNHTNCDLSGGLHELFYKSEPEENKN